MPETEFSARFTWQLWRQRNRILFAGLLCALMGSCGGGSGGDGSQDTAALTFPSGSLSKYARSVNGLKITEVAHCTYSDEGCWFEVYNPGPTAVSLDGYQVASLAVAPTGGDAYDQLFSLPNVHVPAGGHAVIAGNPQGAMQRGEQLVYIGSPAQVPYWNTDGYITLINPQGRVDDFVLLGAKQYLRNVYWTGPGIDMAVSGNTGSRPAVVRNPHGVVGHTTYAAAQWESVGFATPGGPNDVRAGAVDSDSDGIPDSAKLPNGTFAGMPLHAMGARPGQRDLFVEVDYMESSDAGVLPRQEALQKVVDAFRARGIAVHFDAGTQFSTSFDPTYFNLGQGNSAVPLEPCVGFAPADCGRNASRLRTVWDWKTTHSDLRRRTTFHYLLFGQSQRTDGTAGSSGRAELPGNDMVVTLGGWGLSTGTSSALNLLINYQASTLMHELGHNLGLQHGGNEPTNDKPNYFSVMNYLYQLAGLDAAPAGGTAYLRWKLRYQRGNLNICSLPNSPCSSSFVMDYSDGTGTTLYENSLLESNNIGRGGDVSHFADWDGSSTPTPTALALDLNGDGLLSALNDFNDWGNIRLPFAPTWQGRMGALLSHARAPAPARPLNPVANDRQPLAEELEPAAATVDAARQVR